MLVFLSITNKTPASLCAVSFLPGHVWHAGTGKQPSVGLFGSMCFRLNVSGRKLVGFNKETNLHGWRIKCGLVAVGSWKIERPVGMALL